MSVAHRATNGLLISIALLSIALGCRRQPVVKAPTLTATDVRAERRAFDGAPPVIPHASLGAACTTCHTSTGQPVPNMAYAPANPHGNSGALQNCRQCHLFQRDDGVFAESTFIPLADGLTSGDRLFPGAPPMIPHSLSMRDNCAACHAGPSARPEVRCSHPERVHCVQCHLPQTDAEQFTSVAQVKASTP